MSMKALFGSLVLLIGCESADSGKPAGANHEPVVTIISHVDGDSEVEGHAFTLRGTVSDVDEAADNLVATWYTGAREICGATSVSADGSTVCDATLVAGEETVVLVGLDSEGASGTARVTLTLDPSGSPTVTILSPEATGTYAAGEAFDVSALVADAEDAPAELTAVWEDEDGKSVALDGTPDDAGALVDTLTLAEGAHALTVTVTDSSGKTGAATVEFTVGAGNTAPTCTITAPADGAHAPVGTSVTFGGLLDDAEVAPELLTAAWTSDLDGNIGGGAVAADGTSSVTLDTLSFGTHVITLTGTDDKGSTCTDTVLYTVGDPPEATIDAPLDGDLTNEGEDIVFLGSVIDVETAPDAISVIWESDLDGVLDTAPADASGVTTFDSSALSTGDHTISLTAVDEDGLYDVATVLITVNGLPTAPVVSISPSAPGAADDLTAVIDSPSIDPEGDAITYAYAWTVDGVGTAYTGAVVPASATTRDDVWTVTVTPNDGAGVGPAGTASVTIQNSTPTLADVTIVPDPAYEGDTLTCVLGALADADGDSVVVTYVWSVNGVTLATTTATLDDSNWSRDDVVTCTATPTDGTTAGTPVTSAAITIANSLPSVTDVVITPVLPDVSDTLDCTVSGYFDADGDADGTTIAWTVNGVVAGRSDTLSGAFAGGDEVVCTATPFDGTDVGAAMSDTVVIENTLPILASVSLSPLSPTEADTLTCTPGATTDADGTTSFTYVYAWRVDGSAIGATSATLSPANFARGNVVQCTAAPDDGLDVGAAVASNTVTVSNTAPVVSSVTLSPSTVGTNDTLTASVSASDIDGDTVTLTYAWTVNGASVGTSTSSLAGTTYFDRGDVVVLTVTPSDGTSSGSAASATVTITNALPSISSVTVSPDPAYVTSTLACAYSGFSDTDGDADASTLAWTINGTAAGSSTTLSSGFASGDVVACTMTPFDGTDVGTAVSDSLTITNSPPVLASVSLTPTSADEASTLTCTPGATTDADGTTSFAHHYAWTVNGSVIAPTSTTLTGSYFSSGNTVFCTITPNDGTDNGAAVSSNTVTISNTAPVVSSVTLSSYAPYTDDTLTATVASSDGDGDTVTLRYAWYVNGSLTSTTTSTLSGATSFSRGDTVYVRVTPNDGSVDGTAVSSLAATVQNSIPTITSVAITPASASASDILTCGVTGYSDADGDASASTTQWLVNAVPAGTGSTLAGVFVRADVVSCTVTPNDGTDAGTARTSANVTIANSLPVIASVTLTPTTAYEADTLTCTPGTVSDADGTTSFTYVYTWRVGGAPTSIATATITGTNFSRGQAVYCTVAANDGSGSGAAAASNTVTIANTAPEMVSVALSTYAPTTNTTLSTTVTSTDADGDSRTYTYAWYVNDTLVSPTISALLGTTYFSRGDTIYASVTPSDGTTTGAAMASAVATVANSAPTIASVNITPTSASASDTLTCNINTFADADGDANASTYSWSVNGAVAGTSSTLSGAFVRGDSVTCSVTPNDGTDAGTTRTSTAMTIANATPVIASVSLAPTTAYEADTLTCTPGATTDADGTTTFSYTYSWHVNGTAISQTTATLSGTYFSKSQVVYCTVSASDGTGSGSGVSSNSVTISNTAPVISSVALSSYAPGTSATLTTSVTSSDADGDARTLTYVWYVNGSAVAATTSSLAGTSYFSRGDEVYVSVTPSDSASTGAAVTSPIATVVNTAPSISTVTITPTTATVADTLTCTPGGYSDADGDSASYTYAWTVNGTAAGTASTLAGVFARGDAVICTVTPSDGTDAGSPRASSSFTIANSAPVLASVALTPTTAYEGSTLTCTPGTTTDADGATSFTYTYTWHVAGSLISQTSATLTGTYFAKNQAVYCSATPSDGTTAGAAVSSNTVTISNTAPTVTSVALSSYSPTTSATITTTVVSADADGDARTLSYAWYVNGSLVGATGSSLSGVTYFSRGDTVYVSVTASDGSASGTAVASPVATIANSAPSITSVAISPTTAYAADTLTCTVTGYSDADGDASVSTTAWTINGVAAGTGSTLSGGFYRGDSVICAVTPNDGTDTGTVRTSSARTIANTVPVLASVSLTPTTAYEASTLTCTPGTTTDADGTTIFTYSYAWYVNSSLISQTTQTLSGSYFSKSQVVYCKATPNDGTGSGVAVSSNTVTISNTAPVISSVTLSSYSPGTSDTITTSVSSSDADGDARTLTYAWYVNGSAIAATTASLSGVTYFSRGDTVYVRVTPSDGSASGTAVTSSTATVVNSAPSAPVVGIFPTDPEEGLDDLACSLDAASTDADGDSITYTFSWTVDGAAYTGATTTATTSTVAASATVAGELWACSATANDGTVSGVAGVQNVTILTESYTIGYASDFATPGTGSSAGGYSLGQSITVSSAVSLYQLGLRMRLSDTDSGRMALYTNSSGAPGTLVAYTTLQTLPSGAVEADVVGGPISLSAGTYWIVWNFSGTVYAGYTTVGASGNTIAYRTLSSSSSFPTTFGAATTYSGQFLNLYMVVR